MGDLDGVRLLVLGAGRHQVPLIRRAVDRGAEVVTSDYLPDAPGRAFATHPVLGDALDVDVNRRIAQDHDVDAITTIGTDQAIVAVATVAADLGLPCHVGPEAAMLATNKVPMRAALAAHGVPVPTSVTVRSVDDTRDVELDGPVVVKPADGQGQRATVRVTRRASLDDAVADAIAVSRSATAVVERFVSGPEATASVWLDGGRTQLVGVADRLTYNPPPALGIALRHSTPSRHAADRLDLVADVAERTAAAYGMEDGPLYIQFLCTPDGGVVVMEAAARVGGGHEPQLYARTTPFDLVDLSIDLAVEGTTRPPCFDARVDRGPAGAVTFVVARPGRFAELSDPSALVTAGLVDDAGWYRPTGHVQPAVSDGQGRVGYLLATGPDLDAVHRRSAAAYDRLEARDEAGRQLVYWPEGSLLLAD